MTKKFNAYLEKIVEQLNTDYLTKSVEVQRLVEDLQAVGASFQYASLESLREQVEVYMQSADFEALSEAEKRKIQKGWKMVFGKLRKVGQGVADTIKGIGKGAVKLAKELTFTPTKPRRTAAQIQAAHDKRVADIEADYQAKKAKREKEWDAEREQLRRDADRQRSADAAAKRDAAYSDWKRGFEKKHGAGSADWRD